jgi:hypothetical protein
VDLRVQNIAEILSIFLRSAFGRDADLGLLGGNDLLADFKECLKNLPVLA